MLKKIKLHWQILIALVLAIFFGIMFPDMYKIDEQFFNNLKEREGYYHQLAEVVFGDDQGKVLSKRVFTEKLKGYIDESEYHKTSQLYIEAATYNPYASKVTWMGTIFLRGLTMLIAPLVLSSIVSGVANIGTGTNLGRLGLKTFGYYITSSVLAIFTGLLMVNILTPGAGMNLPVPEQQQQGINIGDISDTLIQIVPTNIFQSLSENHMLSIIFFAILTGFFITRIRKAYRIFLTDMFNAFFELMMKITMFVIKFTPLGIFGIVVGVVASQSDLLSLAKSMGVYMLAVASALIIHAVVTLPLLVRYVGKSNPVKHFRAMQTPLLTAFSTSSSGATLPLTMTTVEQKSGVSNKISSFTLPLGATINMDGTALYECVAAIFIAQAYGIDLSFGLQLVVVFTALLASIGAAAVPMAGLVMITIVLTAVGLPLEGIGLILAVDRILDMLRTATNVWSDSCGAVIIAKSEGEILRV